MRPATNNVEATAAAILLPPLAVYLQRGMGRDFIVAALLTCLGWVPGVLFALWTVLAR